MCVVRFAAAEAIWLPTAEAQLLESLLDMKLLDLPPTIDFRAHLIGDERTRAAPGHLG